MRKKISLASGEWSPYTSKHLPEYGLFTKIVSQAFFLSGIEVEYTFLDSWSRSYVLTKKGEYDGNFPLIPAAARQKYFYFTDPVIIHTYVFFQQKGSDFDWKTTKAKRPVRGDIHPVPQTNKPHTQPSEFPNNFMA